MLAFELPRFLITESTRNEDPFHKSAEAWDSFQKVSRSNLREIRKILLDAAALDFDRIFDEHVNDGGTRFQLEAERDLGKTVPEFIAAANGLRHALDKLYKKPITWNHYERGEFTKVAVTTDDLTVERSMRLPATFPENNGYILGNRVGPDPITSGYGVWIEVAPSAENVRGLHMPIQEMFAIREANTVL